MLGELFRSKVNGSGKNMHTQRKCENVESVLGRC